MKKITIGIVVSEFNYDISMMMLERAKVHAEFLGVAVKTIMNVPGVFDMPLAVDKLLQDKEIDGVVTLGAVIHGETKHDELIIEHTTRKIVDLSVSYTMKFLTISRSTSGARRPLTVVSSCVRSSGLS
jgi:6,7-dimethyl-8-ribityllumazine synthase